METYAARCKQSLQILLLLLPRTWFYFSQTLWTMKACECVFMCIAGGIYRSRCRVWRSADRSVGWLVCSDANNFYYAFSGVGHFLLVCFLFFFCHHFVPHTHTHTFGAHCVWLCTPPLIYTSLFWIPFAHCCCYRSWLWSRLSAWLRLHKQFVLKVFAGKRFVANLMHGQRY